MKRTFLLLAAVLLISSSVVMTSASADDKDFSAKPVSISSLSLNNHGAGH